MGLFSKPEAPPVEPAELHSTPDGDFITLNGAPLRPKQADAGGVLTTYKLVGRNDPELGFVAPPAMTIICEFGSVSLGGTIELDQQAYQVLSKNAVLVPVEALS